MGTREGHRSPGREPHMAGAPLPRRADRALPRLRDERRGFGGCQALKVAPAVHSPHTAGAMSRENVEVVRRVHEAINARDSEALERLLDPAIVWVQNPNAPDPGTLHGHDGVRELRAMVDDAFEDVRLDVDRFLDGGETVVALGQMHARGKGSRVEIREARAWVWWVRDGKVVRHE